MTDTRKVAVIGSGLAGLTTAYLLRREGVEVWLLEKSDKLGFHSSSLDLDIPAIESVDVGKGFGKWRQPKGKSGRRSGQGARKWTVDVPMRSFQGGYYPLLISLYKHLKLPLHPTTYTFSFSRLFDPFSHSDSKPYFIYSGANGLSTPSFPSGAWRSPQNWTLCLIQFISNAICYLILLILAFLQHHGLLPLDETTPTKTFVSHTRRILNHPLPFADRLLPSTRLGNVFSTFIEEIVIPLFSAVGTMTRNDVYQTPAKYILDYVYLTLGTSHYVLGGGTSAGTVAARLSKSVSEQGNGHLRLVCEISGIRYMKEGAKNGIIIEFSDDHLSVDQVVIATQCRAAESLLGMLEDSLIKVGEKEELWRVRSMRRGLTGVEYRDTIVINHRDSSVLPAKKDRREINLLQPVFPGHHVVRQGSDVPNLNRLSVNTSSSSTPSLVSPASTESSSGCTTPTVDHDIIKTATPMPYFAPLNDTVYTMATHVMLPPPGVRDRVDPVYQTTNPVIPIDSRTMLGVAQLERALPLKSPSETLQLLHPRQTPDANSAIHLVGSYAYPGIPLLEGCVGSAKKVVEIIVSKRSEPIGGIDWDTGRGGRLVRAWRWTWRK